MSVDDAGSHRDAALLRLVNRKIRKALRQTSYLHFVRAVWRARTPFLIGHHTRRIADALSVGVRNLMSGRSTRMVITVPFRHGKSDLASRYFPPFVLGRCPDSEVMLVSYSAALAQEFSRDAMSIIRSEPYSDIFNAHIDPASHAVGRWGIHGHRGKFFPVGLGGSITGKGADVLIIDDYLRNRAEAESAAQRDKIWEAFTNDLLTRLAPVHLCLVVATRWHQDDLIGRIINRMRSDSDFPTFDFLQFPAKSECYPSGYLFPERFSESWYESQFASLGNYGSAALLQCDPVLRGGNLLKTDNIQFVDTFSAFPGDLRWVRFWDLASSVKQRMKDDPDYTVGTLAAVRSEGASRTLYVADVRRIRGEAPERNRMIIATALSDGPAVIQGVESVAGYKDTYTTLNELLAGHSIVRKVNVSGDKIMRAEKLEPLFEAGRVVILRGAWNLPWLDELAAFPSGTHDDQVDSLSGACELALREVRATEIYTPNITLDPPDILF